jgi:putative FmdB family regulatory protein
MPIYEYRCAACGHEIEALQKLSEAPLTECPACHEPQLKKLLSAAGFQLKGSGWYVTDFRNSGSKSSGKDKATTKPAATSGDNGGSASAGSSESVASTDAKSADKPSTSSTSESKPAATAPSTPKSDS